MAIGVLLKSLILLDECLQSVLSDACCILEIKFCSKLQCSLYATLAAVADADFVLSLFRE